MEEEFKKELKALLDKYDFSLHIDFDRLGACGDKEAVLIVENNAFDVEAIFFDLDEFCERKIC